MRGAGSPARRRVPREGRGRDGSVLKLVRRCRSLSSPPWLGIPESEPSFPTCDESANRRAERDTVHGSLLCPQSCVAMSPSWGLFSSPALYLLSTTPAWRPRRGPSWRCDRLLQGRSPGGHSRPRRRTQLGSKPRATPRFTGSARISRPSLHLRQGGMSGTRPSTPDRPRPSPPGSVLATPRSPKVDREISER